MRGRILIPLLAFLSFETATIAQIWPEVPISIPQKITQSTTIETFPILGGVILYTVLDQL